MDDVPSPQQVVAVRTIQTISGVFSIVGSFTIMTLIFRSKQKLKSSFNRIMLGLTTSDMLQSSYFALSFVEPQEINQCNLQAMMGVIGINLSVLYNCSLSIY